MSKLRGMVLGSFVGDALALGPHWIYNMEDIKAQLGDITGMTAPVMNYHKDKIKGDFTHYGDQALMVFQYLKVNRRFEKQSFYKCYMEFFRHYEGYMDHATKEVMDHLTRGIPIGSHSSELGGMVRFAPIIFLNDSDKHTGIEEVLLQTHMTHDDDKLLERTRFLTHMTYLVLKGESPSKAVKILKKDIPKYIFDDLEHVKSLLGEPVHLAIKHLGQSSDSEYAFPAALYFILRYEEDFKQALIENVMAGGDSAARGMVIGAILGAYHGEERLPISWLASMTQLKKLESLMMT